MEREGNVYTSCNWGTWNDPQRLGKGMEIAGNWRTSQDHPNYRILEISQNTERSPGVLRRLSVTQIPVKDHQLTLVGKTREK